MEVLLSVHTHVVCQQSSASVVDDEAQRLHLEGLHHGQQRRVDLQTAVRTHCDFRLSSEELAETIREEVGQLFQVEGAERWGVELRYDLVVQREIKDPHLQAVIKGAFVRWHSSKQVVNDGVLYGYLDLNGGTSRDLVNEHPHLMLSVDFSRR